MQCNKYRNMYHQCTVAGHITTEATEYSSGAVVAVVARCRDMECKAVQQLELVCDAELANHACQLASLLTM